MTELNREVAELGEHGVAPNDNGVPDPDQEESGEDRAAESAAEPSDPPAEGDPAPATPPTSAPAG